MDNNRAISKVLLFGSVVLMLALTSCKAPLSGTETITAPAPALTAFSFVAANNKALSVDVTATLSGTKITATVPYGTDKSALVATFSTTGSSIKIGTVAQNSASTATDFTNSVTYQVTAADSSTQNYTVTVSTASNVGKAITAFSFVAASNSALSADVTATLSGTKITATVPYGTDKTALVATFSTTGISVKIGTTTETSASTANDFSSVVTYQVTGVDGSTQNYTVTVSTVLNSAKAITVFSFVAANNTGLLADYPVTLSGTTLTATVPYGYAGTTLTPTFTLSAGATAKVGTTLQTSGVSSNNFEPNVTYTISAADGSTQNYTVKIINSPIPDTGQTTGYTTTFGEDNDYSINTPSYTDQGNGTVVDKITGLTWQKCSFGLNASNCAGLAVTKSWIAAGTYCTNLTLGGSSAWRLPTRTELSWIAKKEGSAPRINPVFPATVSSLYWTSTVYATDTTKAWFVGFSTNDLGIASITGNTYIRCVH